MSQQTISPALIAGLKWRTIGTSKLAVRVVLFGRRADAQIGPGRSKTWRPLARVSVKYHGFAHICWQLSIVGHGTDECLTFTSFNRALSLAE